jgi:hypothetical protein
MKSAVLLRRFKKKNVADALHAETVQMLKASNLADHLGVGRVLFETYFAMFVQVLGSSTYDHAPLGILFSELKFRMSTRFIEARIMHVSGDCNTPAHVLAAFGTVVSHGDHSLWISNYPADVTREVTSNLAVS